MIIGAGGGLLGLTPKIHDHGWPSILPTTVLIQTQRFAHNEWPLDELARRFDGSGSGDRLSERQWRQLANVCMDVLSGEHNDTVKGRACLIVATAIYNDSVAPKDGLGDDLYALATAGPFDESVALWFIQAGVFSRLGDERSRVADAINHVMVTSTQEWDIILNLLPNIARLPPEDQPLFLPGLGKLAARAGAGSMLLPTESDAIQRAQLGVINASYPVGAVSDEQLTEHVGERWFEMDELSMPVLTRLTSHADPNARQCTARHLAGRRDDRTEAVANLRRLLDDDDPRIRLAAISGLEQLDAYSESFPTQLSGFAEHGPEEVRVEALEVLARIGPPADDAYPALLRILEREEDYPIWDYVIDAIESIKEGGSEFWLPDRDGHIPAVRNEDR